MPPSDEQVTFQVLNANLQALRDLMSANFQTVHVQLEHLAQLSPEVEGLKRDVGELRADFAASIASMNGLQEDVANLPDHYVRKDELERRFVTHEQYDADKFWRKAYVPGFVLSALAIIVSVLVGVGVHF